MFKDKYKKDMSKIKPSSQLKQRVLDEEQKSSQKFRFSGRLAALALSICLLFSAVVAGSFLQNGNIFENLFKGINKSPSSNSHGTIPLNAVTNYADVFNAIKQEEARNEEYQNNLNSYMKDHVDLEYESNDLQSSIDIMLPSSPREKEDNDYSDTNNQVKGVQEGDIIKTDGKYIYTVHDERRMPYREDGYKYGLNGGAGVFIHSAENGKLEQVAKINTSFDNAEVCSVLEIMLFKDRLIVLKEGSIEVIKEGNDGKDPLGRIEIITAADIYDITDRANPVLLNTLFQSGKYSESRMVGEVLYIITNYVVEDMLEEYPETFIPAVYAGDEFSLIKASSIIMQRDQTGKTYFVITGIDVTKPKEHISSKAMLGYGGTIYANDKNMYIANEQNHFRGLNFGFGFMFRSYFLDTSLFNKELEKYKVGDKVIAVNKTDIFRFSLDDGKVEFGASTTIDGRLLNQFAMDEYEGNLRVATTIREDSGVIEERSFYKSVFSEESIQPEQELVTSIANTMSEPEEIKYKVLVSQSARSFSNLYILDSNLKQQGLVIELGLDEDIYSVRFDGDIGYMVTFRQIDPLFAIDLKDAKNPKVLSELKIPGFSNYMHPYGEGLLFGFGMDATEDGVVTGLKLSMFDVMDKTDVKEVSIKKVGKGYGYSEARYNHKAIMVNPEKNLIGFPVTSYNTKVELEYYFYSYENGSFVEKGVMSPSFGNKIKLDYASMRGIYIGDYGYLFVEGVGIVSYDLNSFTKVDSVLY